MIAPLRKQYRAFEKQHHDRFLQMLSQIRNQASVAFRQLRREHKEEMIEEVLANAYCAFVQLVRRGKADIAYATPLTTYAIRQVLAGRRVCTRLNTRDVTSVATQRQRGFCLESLQSGLSEEGAWIEILADNTLTPVPDQVAFRLDFSAWLRLQDRRSRKLVRFLALGNSATEAARHFGVSGPRVSQVRSELRNSWEVFQGEAT